MMSEADLVWNRATLDRDESILGVGDRALRSLLRAHGLTMNGGVLHAVEVLSAEQVAAASSGYRFFDYPIVGDLLLRARAVIERGDESEMHERQFNEEYDCQIPDDSTLFDRFENHFLTHPKDFVPIN